MSYYDYVEFEWDELKASKNFKKHGVTFNEAITIWKDNGAIEMFDLNHSSSEERWIRLGFSSQLRFIVVVYCEKSEARLRIISARRATISERRQYHEK